MNGEKYLNIDTEAVLRFVSWQLDEVRKMLQNASISDLEVELKPDGTVVTALDKEIEKSLRAALMDAFPNHGIMGEEQPDHQPDAEYQWVLDPIDGTQEFVNGSALYGVLISLNYRDKPIVAALDHPAMDIRVQAASGAGCICNGEQIKISARRFCYGVVLPAFIDFNKYEDESALYYDIIKAYPNYRTFRSCFGHTSTLKSQTLLTYEHDVNLWDINATRLLIEEAGGSFYVLRRRDTVDNSAYSVVFGLPSEVERFVERFQAYFT